ncbi:hypothetical protein [Silvimonas iriomotensis]|uniref:Uncharacterized protein n=1 Tax=Silvimonas iriomotensis TaxID=449662 RepID=A0ABQ2PB06_9NEIS|nr:hypothetical protein [Silvimonas iriomotensis]GGP22693.1 hypothetical protein GCM10010970_26930 [Silvimonas iriomotensis]
MNVNLSPASTSYSSNTQSGSASTLTAAAQEARETPTQTAQEARKGDHQAQRLQAREAQAAANATGSTDQRSSLVIGNSGQNVDIKV